jgi:DNA-directed RNA polymerase specialized sigma24 family protein
VGRGTPVDLEEFLAARLSTLLRFATALTGDPHRAEDVVQDASSGPAPLAPDQCHGRP